ncbi:serine/threonine-protein kinase STY46-like [Punica granatum]|uniref:Serine/threonine-protein kinase STY46-like n=3 Tax=Punica granatum TaxID=22663 RepID=A0A6P8DIZ7_PUNGR|nr:serine/threonine-protein kinase STY46-like [Punica granatum]
MIMSLNGTYNPNNTDGRNPRRSNAADARRSQACCWNLSGCLEMPMGAVVSSPNHSHPHHQQPLQNRSHQSPEQSISELEQQVRDLEREVQKQKELRIMYGKRMERTQDYLKYCLQVAQENGFLHLLMNPKDTQECLLSPHNFMIGNNVWLNGSPAQFPALVPSQPSDLDLISNQARANGWSIDPLEIEMKDQIGRGSTADIYRATWRGLDVAVKYMSPEFFHSNPSGAAFFAQELHTLSRQRHRFVLQLMGACLQPPDRAWVVTELLSTTLKEWLHGPGKAHQPRDLASSLPLPPMEERLARAVEIAQAMQYLHEQRPRVVHRDLKPSNVFLDDALHVRVADFGHARFLRDGEYALTAEIGTYVYMAPEVIKCEPYDEKCDVYSFGVIVNELVTGDHPYIDIDAGPAKIAMEVAEGILRPALPADNDVQLGELIELICLSWNQDPSLRLPLSSITPKLKEIQRKFAEINVS